MVTMHSLDGLSWYQECSITDFPLNFSYVLLIYFEIMMLFAQLICWFLFSCFFLLLLKSKKTKSFFGVVDAVWKGSGKGVAEESAVK